MGYHMHVRKINRIEYGGAVFDGNHHHELIRLFLDFGENVFVNETEDNIEIDKDDFKEGIRSIRAMTDNDFKEEYPNLGTTCGRERVADILQELLKDSDPEDHNVTLDWY